MVISNPAFRGGGSNTGGEFETTDVTSASDDPLFGLGTVLRAPAELTVEGTQEAGQLVLSATSGSDEDSGDMAVGAGVGVLVVGLLALFAFMD